MTGVGSPGFWVVLAVVLAIGLALIIRNERAKRMRPTQRRGVAPHDQPKLILSEVGPDGNFNQHVRAYHVTTDLRAYADIFVPSDRKG